MPLWSASKTAYFLYPIAPGIIPAARNFAKAAKEAGVRSLVNMSQISAREDSASHAARNHWLAERIFDEAGTPTIHLRPTFFADWLTYPWFARDIADHGRIEFPFADGRHAPLASGDLGRVIAHLLVAPDDHDGAIYKLHGPTEMNHDDIAAVVGDVLGKHVTYVPGTIESFKTKLDAIGFPEFLIQHLVEVAKDYRNGLFSGTNTHVLDITGTPPLALRDFIAAHRQSFASSRLPDLS